MLVRAPWFKVVNAEVNGTDFTGVSFTTDALDLGDASGYSIQFKWAGNGVGTVKIEENDTPGSVPDADGWSVVEGSEGDVPGTGSPYRFKCPVGEATSRWIRFVYERASGDLTGVELSATLKD